MSEPRMFGIVPAAGIGSRMGVQQPKQYIELGGKTILEHALSRLLEANFLTQIIVPLAPADKVGEAIIARYADVVRVEGGPRRSDSVRAALTFLESVASPQDWILVHDAARPLVSPEALARVRKALDTASVGVVLGSPVKETIKRCDPHGLILETPERASLWQAQTPQAFRYGLLSQALSGDEDFLDESQAVEALGLSPQMVLNPDINLKITRPDDLTVAAFLLGERPCE